MGNIFKYLWIVEMVINLLKEIFEKKKQLEDENDDTVRARLREEIAKLEDTKNELEKKANAASDNRTA